MNDRPRNRQQNVVLPVKEASDIAFIILEAREIAQKIGFADVDEALISTAVSELATNILKYAVQGEIQLKELDTPRGRGMEIVSTDQGPGIANVEQVLQEDYVSQDGLGIGLSSLNRILDECHIETAPGRGTRVTARKWRDLVT
ncbi:MAG: anti-sigma regulatory factor [Spirochaetales bacterium]|nr:anti-sigma regulatory factor [Spirochaetales bacterium]